MRVHQLVHLALGLSDAGPGRCRRRARRRSSTRRTGGGSPPRCGGIQNIISGHAEPLDRARQPPAAEGLAPEVRRLGGPGGLGGEANMAAGIGRNRRIRRAHRPTARRSCSTARPRKTFSAEVLQAASPRCPSARCPAWCTPSAAPAPRSRWKAVVLARPVSGTGSKSPLESPRLADLHGG